MTNDEDFFSTVLVPLARWARKRPMTRTHSSDANGPFCMFNILVVVRPSCVTPGQQQSSSTETVSRSSPVAPARTYVPHRWNRSMFGKTGRWQTHCFQNPRTRSRTSLGECSMKIRAGRVASRFSRGVSKDQRTPAGCASAHPECPRERNGRAARTNKSAENAPCLARAPFCIAAPSLPLLHGCFCPLFMGGLRPYGLDGIAEVSIRGGGSGWDPGKVLPVIEGELGSSAIPIGTWKRQPLRVQVSDHTLLEHCSRF